MLCQRARNHPVQLLGNMWSTRVFTFTAPPPPPPEEACLSPIGALAPDARSIGARAAAQHSLSIAAGCFHLKNYNLFLSARQILQTGTCYWDTNVDSKWNCCQCLYTLSWNAFAFLPCNKKELALTQEKIDPYQCQRVGHSRPFLPWLLLLLLIVSLSTIIGAMDLSLPMSTKTNLQKELSKLF